MVCQKLCQNNVSGWGSLKERILVFEILRPMTYDPIFLTSAWVYVISIAKEF